jgi:hypothetical protein
MEQGKEENQGNRWPEDVLIGFEGYRNKKSACGGRRPEGRQEEDFIVSEGPRWDVVFMKRKNCNFVHEE